MSKSEGTESISPELNLAMAFYSNCLRDYFSTFGTYTTATSILVAAIGFMARLDQYPLLVLIVAACGLILCWQWYISTASMRNQYGHFKGRIKELEKEAGVFLLSRWLLTADLERGRSSDRDLSPEEKEKVERDRLQLDWTFQFLSSPFGLRGTMLPVLYAAVFLGVGISFSPSFFSFFFPPFLTFWTVARAQKAAFVGTFLWLLLVPIGIHLLRNKRLRKRAAGLNEKTEISGGPGYAGGSASAKRLLSRVWFHTMRVLKPAAVYFALVFGLGFLLGTIRVLWVVPLLGTRTAELLELPLMLVAIGLSARFINARFPDPKAPAARFGIGWVALGLLLVAEIGLGVALRGVSPLEVLTDRDPVSGTAYYASLLLFASLPWLFARGVRRPPSEKLKKTSW